MIFCLTNVSLYVLYYMYYHHTLYRNCFIFDRMRTVKNDVPVPEPSKAAKFEMKFKPLNSSALPESENGTAPKAPPPPDLSSKWRPLGAPTSQSDAVKNAFERASPDHSDEQRKMERDKIPPRDDRNYRRKSRSFSRSPVRRGRRSRSYSRSRSRSKSRSRSR